MTELPSAASSNALITGAAGQDGWYLAQTLIAAGRDVFGFVQADDAQRLPPGVRPIVGDLRDVDSVARAVTQARPGEIYNLAGVSSVGRSWQRPVETFEVNVIGVLNLIEAVQRYGARADQPPRLIQASSAEIFGSAPAPQNENTPIDPANPYGVSKAAAHQLIAINRAAGMWAASAILYNHESPRRPDTFVTRRITRGVAEVVSGRRATLSLGNLDAVRDWGFAGDYMSALHLIADHDRPDDYVIATGVSHTVADFVAAAFAHVGITDWRERVEIDRDLVRPTDPAEQRGDAAKARRELGWAPTIGFDELVGLMVEQDLAELGAGADR